MDDLKEIIAKNLVQLRTQAGFTQLQLAEKLNYSDKAVSKWERADAIPDLRVLIKIAEIYNVTLDELVSGSSEIVLKPKMNLGKKRLLVCLLSVVLSFFVGALAFIVLNFIPVCAPYSVLAFNLSSIASAILLTVYACVWGNRLHKALSSSLIAWMLVVAVHVSLWLFYNTDTIWLFYIAAGVFQVLVILWFVFRKVK